MARIPSITRGYRHSPLVPPGPSRADAGLARPVLLTESCPTQVLALSCLRSPLRSENLSLTPNPCQGPGLWYSNHGNNGNRILGRDIDRDWDRRGFPRGTVAKNLSANAGHARDEGSIPGLGRSPGERNDNPLQYSCLENFMDRGAWWAIVHRVSKSRTRLSTHTGHGTWARHGRDIVANTPRGRDDRTRDERDT